MYNNSHLEDLTEVFLMQKPREFDTSRDFLFPQPYGLMANLGLIDVVTIIQAK